MEEVEVIEIKKVDLKDPIMIEGLPGVGNVGKLVAEHMIHELKGEKIIEIYSSHFPPQVLVKGNGTVRLTRNEIYACRTDKLDMLILSGDYQSTTNRGHYLLVETFLDIAEKYNVKMIYTLGGYGIGRFVEKQVVIGAANDASLVEEMKKYDVEFKADEPGGGIVGASGLLLGLGQRRGIKAVCLMGLTSGYLVDPKSAQAVLNVLCKTLKIEIDTRALEERAKEMEAVIERLKKMEERAHIPRRPGEELGYIR